MADNILINGVIGGSVRVRYEDDVHTEMPLTTLYTDLNDSEYCIDLSETMSATFIYMDIEEVVTTIILPIILVLGLSTNSAFLFVVAKVSAMRTVTNAYLVNLAVGDMLFLIVAISDKLWSYMTSELVQDHSARSTFSCVALNVIQYTCLFTCELLITAVAVERYYAICHPWFRTYRTHLYRKIIVSIWIVSALFAATMTPAFCKLATYCLAWPDGEQYDHLPNEWVVCTFIHIKARIYGDMLRTVPFFLALIVNVVLYTLIINKLTKSAKDEVSKTSRKIRNQVATMLFVNTTVFFALMSPFTIFSVFLMFDSHREKRVLSPEGRRMYVQIARILSYSNSVVNPLIYAATNARYKKAFRIAFGCSNDTLAPVGLHKIVHRKETPLTVTTSN